MKRERTTVAVVGGGITGLMAALRASDQAPTLLLEASAEHLGGQIRTHRTDDGLFEGGPDTFLTTKPGALELCRELGLEREIIHLPPPSGSTTILRCGRFLPVPEGLSMLAPTRVGPLLRSPLFSLRGKLRMLAEPLVPVRPEAAGDESLGDFVRRRLGREVFERLAEPVLASLFTADADRLSLRTVMPRMAELERRYGSLARAARSRSPGRAPGRGHGSAAPAATLAGGLGSLVEALAARLPAGTLRRGARLDRLERLPPGGGWRLRLRDGSVVDADAVVLAAPAPVIGDALDDVEPVLADELRALRYAPCATVNLLYGPEAATRLPPGHGFFVPRTERSPLLAVSFVSRKLPERAGGGRLLLRAFVGGALHPGIVDLGESELCEWTHRELVPRLGLLGPPEARYATLFQRAMPQYDVGFGERLAVIRARLSALPGLWLAGSPVGAVGLPDCICSGEDAAASALERIRLVPWGWVLKAKLDTGALTSSLQAEKIRRFERDDEEWVEFEIEVETAHDELEQRKVERPVVRNVRVKRPTGDFDRRAVVELPICIGGNEYETEFTLKDRDPFLYPVLLGRRFLEERALVDSARTFLSTSRCDEEEREASSDS